MHTMRMKVKQAIIIFLEAFRVKSHRSLPRRKGKTWQNLVLGDHTIWELVLHSPNGWKLKLGLSTYYWENGLPTVLVLVRFQQNVHGLLPGREFYVLLVLALLGLFRVQTRNMLPVVIPILFRMTEESPTLVPRSQRFGSWVCEKSDDFKKQLPFESTEVSKQKKKAKHLVLAFISN